jgi:CheY-like chemotaxis protein
MQKPKILIVEDEPIVAFSLKMQLQRSGYEIIGVADSSYEALEFVEKGHPDLILMDFYIRGAMNGIDTVKIVHLHSLIPVIFLSALEDDYIIRQIRTMKLCSFMSKPILIDELKRLIERKLKRSRLGQELSSSLQVRA